MSGVKSLYPVVCWSLFFVLAVGITSAEAAPAGDEAGGDTTPAAATAVPAPETAKDEAGPKGDTAKVQAPPVVELAPAAVSAPPKPAPVPGRGSCTVSV